MQFELYQDRNNWVARYEAMAGPCEIHISCLYKSEAKDLASLAYLETKRIEQKYSRYRDDNIIHSINTSNGISVNIDEETFRLLNYADQCYEISEGMFDITSGVLRKAWKFDGQEAKPDQKLINDLLKRVGWDKAELSTGSFILKQDMEIDLGGIGKEYAVDKVAQQVFEAGGYPLMVNFGGDIRVITPSTHATKWTVGIEDPSLENTPLGHIQITNGAITTSGDSKRFCTYKGKRLGHILNPKTGWPVNQAPQSVTVIGSNCLEAGLVSTLAILNGKDAEEFLEAQEMIHYCAR